MTKIKVIFRPISGDTDNFFKSAMFHECISRPEEYKGFYVYELSRINLGWDYVINSISKLWPGVVFIGHVLTENDNGVDVQNVVFGNNTFGYISSYHADKCESVGVVDGFGFGIRRLLRTQEYEGKSIDIAHLKIGDTVYTTNVDETKKLRDRLSHDWITKEDLPF